MNKQTLFWGGMLLFLVGVAVNFGNQWTKF